jgi:integral membrane protein
MVTVGVFRRLAAIEAVSFLLLLTAAVVKRTADAPLGVAILGPLHGMLFLAYLYCVFELRGNEGWGTSATALIVLGAIVPFGGLAVHRRLADPVPAA